MKIKSQVYFLLSGILIIPVLFFVFIGLIRYFDAPERIFAPGYEELLSTESISQQDWNKIRKYIENSPKNLRCAVVDKNNMVIFFGVVDWYWFLFLLFVPLWFLLFFVQLQSLFWLWKREQGELPTGNLT